MIETQKMIILEGKSLNLFSEENRLRLFLTKFIGHRYFDMFIFLVVTASIVLLGLEDSLDNPQAHLSQEIELANYIIACIFIAEMIIKIIVHGLCM